MSKVGLFPQIIFDALPVVRTLGINGSAYLLTTLNALTITGQTLSEAVWNFPEAVIDSITSQSLAPIVNAILGPIDTIGNTLLDAGRYVLTGVLTRAGAVLSGIPNLLSTVVQSAIGQLRTLVNTALYVGQSVIDAGSIEGAWNAAVDGLLGPGTAFNFLPPPGGGVGPTFKPSIPGALINLTLGLGQPLDPTAAPTSCPGCNPFVSSVRTLVSGAVQQLNAELSFVTNPNPAPPVPTPPPAAAVRVASPRAAAAEASAPAEVDATADTSGAGAQAGSSDNSDSMTKASKHRVSRKAASE